MHPIDEHAAACLADDYRSRRRRGSPDPEKARRKAAVEVFMMFFNVAFTVFASCVLVAGFTYDQAGLWGLGSGAIAALGVVALRLYVPAKVRPRDAAEEQPEDDAEGGWDVSGFILAAIVIPVVMAHGFLLHGWLLVLIVLRFAYTASAATTLGVLAAIIVSITASVCAEYAVVHPLFKRWNIALD